MFVNLLFLLDLGMKEEDLGMNSPLMWLRGNPCDRGVQSLNFQGVGGSHWLQPRLDMGMLGMQPDVYQAMAAAALQEMRSIDSLKPSNPSFLPFQQPQPVPTGSGPVGLGATQMVHQSQPAFIPENQPVSQQPSHLISQQSNHLIPFNNQQQTLLPMISSIQNQNFSDSNANPMNLLGVETSHLLNMPRSTSMLTSTGWPAKRVAVDPLLLSGASQSLLHQVEQLGPPSHANLSPNTNLSQDAVSLPPFPGRECSIDQGPNNNHQSNSLFGANVNNPNLFMQGSIGDSLTMPLTSSSYNMSNAGNGFSMNPTVAPSSCGNESGFLQSPENAGQAGQTNPPTRTFVKVNLFCYLYISCCIDVR